MKLKYLLISLCINLSFIYLFSNKRAVNKFKNKQFISVLIDSKVNIEEKTNITKSKKHNEHVISKKEEPLENNFLNNKIIDKNVDLANIFISLPAIQYPKTSIYRGEQGLVKVDVTVESSKKIRVKLIKSSGYISLDRSALNVAKNLKLKENIVDISFPVNFIIDFDFIL